MFGGGLMTQLTLNLGRNVIFITQLTKITQQSQKTYIYSLQ